MNDEQNKTTKLEKNHNFIVLRTVLVVLKYRIVLLLSLTNTLTQRETFLFTIVVLCDSVVVILCGVHIFGVFNCYVFCAFEIRHTTFMALAIRSIKYGHWLNRIHIVNWIKRNIWTVDKNRSKIKCSHRWRISVYFYSYWVCWLADKNKRFIFVSFRSILFAFKH